MHVNRRELNMLAVILAWVAVAIVVVVVALYALARQSGPSTSFGQSEDFNPFVLIGIAFAIIAVVAIPVMLSVRSDRKSIEKIVNS